MKKINITRRFKAFAVGAVMAVAAVVSPFNFNDKKIKSRCKKIKMFKNGILMGIFQSSRELEMQSEQLFLE